MKQENKRAYLAPSIKVVSVRSERGFQSSGDVGGDGDGGVSDDNQDLVAPSSVKDGFFGKRF